MKIIVAVVVYDRLQNVEEWIRCWKQCDTKNAELYIIHNYANEEDLHKCRTSCENAGIKHVRRQNIGMDIGALQDVCRGRLEGFPNEWDYLLWSTDDVIPMSKGFIEQYLSILNQTGVGVACLEVSREVKTHIRTTGFMISQKTASKLTFPVDKVITKAHCYDFEHRGSRAFYEQIKAMSLGIVQINPDYRKACMWDTHVRGHLSRWKEHYREFPFENPSKDKKVTIICPVHNRFPQVLGSFINQTHTNWELLLIHDGPNSTNLRQLVDEINDRRIKYIETPAKWGNWGHPIRKWALKNMNELSPDAKYIVITNDDNCHFPHYLEYLLQGFEDSEKVASYCSKFVHAYMSPQADGDYKYGVIETKLQLGYIDCSCVMVRKEVACDIGWTDMGYSSDWEFFSKIIARHGKNKWSCIKGCLVSHN